MNWLRFQQSLEARARAERRRQIERDFPRIVEDLQTAYTEAYRQQFVEQLTREKARWN